LQMIHQLVCRYAAVVTKEVLEEMVKLILASRCEGSVRRKVLELLQEWAAQLRIAHYAVGGGGGRTALVIERSLV
jgi:predicted nucleic acid-binding protein